MKILWEKLFGTAWEAHGKLFPHIGGFILNTAEGTCLTDENTRRLLGVKAGEEYAVLAAAVKGAQAGERQTKNIAVAVCLQDEVYTAGFVSVASQADGEKNVSYDITQRFRKVMDDNLFYYDFQPIVSARDGEVKGWEALMRTEREIGLNPLQILDEAKNAGRLYDIERITLQNTFRFLCENEEAIAGKKLFINSIPAYALSDGDWAELVEKYGAALQHAVIEMTEQTQLDDIRLDAIRLRLQEAGVPLAIDDYGAGYSNTTNLLRYKPDYVKIDRMLIEDINDKPKVQSLVAGLIDFFHQNGYLALAEGVETYEEMKTMIQLGADLIQGYYTARPQRTLLQEVSDELKQQIKAINLQYETRTTTKVYYPQVDETVDLCRIADEYYGGIVIDKEKAAVEGKHGMTPVECPIVIRDGIETQLLLKNIAIKNEKDAPAIDIGENCRVTISLEGHNLLHMRGIWVPQSSSLLIKGNGNMEINAEMYDVYGIGTDSQHSHGKIQIEMTGSLSIKTNGENGIAIGGGKNPDHNPIVVRGGNIRIQSAGLNCVGIGTYNGNCRIDIRKCAVLMDMLATKMTGIGALAGDDNRICLENYAVTLNGAGLNFCGIGVQDGGSGSVEMVSGFVCGQAKSRNNTCIGGYEGKLDCTLRKTEMDFYCEGDYSSGIGDKYGSGDVEIEDATVHFEAHCRLANAIGSEKGKLTLTRVEQDIRINP